MEIIFYLYVTLAVIFILGILVAYIIEGYVPESHPVMKWWRKHVVGVDPEQKSDNNK